MKLKDIITIVNKYPNNESYVDIDIFTLPA